MNASFLGLGLNLRTAALGTALFSASMAGLITAPQAQAREFELGASTGFGAGTNHGHIGLQGHARASGNLTDKLEVVGEGALGHTATGERLNSLDLDVRSAQKGLGFEAGYQHEFDAHTQRNGLHGGLGVRVAESYSSLGLIVGEHADQDYDNHGIEAGFLILNETKLSGGDVVFSVMGEIASLREMSGEGPLAGLYRNQQSKDKGRFRVFGFKLKKKATRENMSYFGEVKITQRSYKTLQYGLGHVTSLQDGSNFNMGVKAGVVFAFGSNSAK